jgi:hypothetical protein
MVMFLAVVVSFDACAFSQQVGQVLAEWLHAPDASAREVFESVWTLRWVEIFKILADFGQPFKAAERQAHLNRSSPSRREVRWKP